MEAEVAVLRRAHARSICAEMHSGFLSVREELPQNIRARCRRPMSELSIPAQRQVERVVDIWSGCRKSYGSAGPWLFGRFSVADIMYAPVALRFLTYEIPVGGTASDFVGAVSGLESVRQWVADSAAEPDSLPFIDELAPAKDAPLTLG